MEEREREKETQRRADEEGPRPVRERERRRREREREERDDAEDRRREELERHALEHPQANAPLQFGAPLAPSTESEAPTSAPPPSGATPLAASSAISLSLAAAAAAAARKRSGGAGPAQGFSLEDEQAQWVPRKKRELVRLDSAKEKDGDAGAPPAAAATSSTSTGGTKSGAASAELVAALAEKVPATREALFAWQVDWTAFDEADLAEKRLRPWIVKKVVEYVGEEEASLRDFILLKLRQHTRAEELEEALVEVLDAEASPFVQRLWRLLVFELLRLNAAK